MRVALPADLHALSEIDPMIGTDSARSKLVESSLNLQQCLLAVDQHDVLGFAIVNDDFFGHAFVALLVVAEQRRRQGVGTCLMSAAERACGRSKLFVSCNRSNLAAQRLFDRCGFKPSGHIENLDDDDDELVYFKAAGDADKR